MKSGVLLDESRAQQARQAVSVLLRIALVTLGGAVATAFVLAYVLAW